MRHAKDEDGGRLSMLIPMPVAMCVGVPTTVEINVRRNETARRRCRGAARVAPGTGAAITDEEMIEEGTQLAWLLGIGFAGEVGWSHGRLEIGVDETTLQGGKMRRLQEAVLIQRGDQMLDVLTGDEMAVKALRKGILEVSDVALAIELTGKKERRRRQQHLRFDHAFRVA